MKIIKTQAQQCLQLMADTNTANTYKTSALQSWAILKQLAKLSWLLLCWVYVGLGWMVERVYNASQLYWAWYDQHKDGNLYQAAAISTGKFLRISAIAIHRYARKRIAGQAEEVIAETLTEPLPTRAQMRDQMATAA